MTIHFFRVSKGCFMTVTMSSKRTIIKTLERKTKENGNYVRPEQEGLLPKYGMKWHPLKWDIEVKLFEEWRCMGFFFNAFTILCNASISMSSSLTRNVNERQPKRQCGGGGDYWIESKGCLFSVSVNLILGAQTLFLMMLKRVEGTRQKFNSWSCIHPVTVISNIVSLALCSIKALQASFKAIWGTSWAIG